MPQEYPVPYRNEKPGTSQLNKVKALVAYLLLCAVPAVAQHPTARPARPAGRFWPIKYLTSTVVFSGPTVRPLAPGLAQA